jgi:hypothetical protein
VVAERKKSGIAGAHPGASDADPSEQTKDKRPDFLTARQLAEALQISEATVHRLRRAGRIPALLLTDKLIRFNLRDVTRALRPKDGHARSESGEEGGQPDEQESPQLSFDDLFADFQK